MKWCDMTLKTTESNTESHIRNNITWDLKKNSWDEMEENKTQWKYNGRKKQNNVKLN